MITDEHVGSSFWLNCWFLEVLRCFHRFLGSLFQRSLCRILGIDFSKVGPTGSPRVPKWNLGQFLSKMNIGLYLPYEEQLVVRARDGQVRVTRVKSPKKFIETIRMLPPIRSLQCVG